MIEVEGEVEEVVIEEVRSPGSCIDEVILLCVG